MKDAKLDKVIGGLNTQYEEMVLWDTCTLCEDVSCDWFNKELDVQ